MNPLDLDGNGTPDYREGWFWRAVGRAIIVGIRTFAAPHTVAYRAVDAWERELAKPPAPPPGTP